LIWFPWLTGDGSNDVQHVFDVGFGLVIWIGIECLEEVSARGGVEGGGVLGDGLVGAAGAIEGVGNVLFAPAGGVEDGRVLGGEFQGVAEHLEAIGELALASDEGVSAVRMCLGECWGDRGCACGGGEGGIDASGGVEAHGFTQEGARFFRDWRGFHPTDGTRTDGYSAGDGR